MNRKIILLLTALSGQFLTQSAYAYTDSSQKHCPPLQFYAGMVGGIERMNGRRTDSLSETFGGVPITSTYAENLRMLENNATLTFLGGFLWKLPTLPVLVGPEFFFGRGNATSNVTDTRLNPAGANYRFYSTDVQRKFFYGGLIRIGHNFCNDYVVSLSFGIDRSQFLTKRILAIDPLARATVIKRTKGFNGFLYGVGLERSFKHVIVGIDLKLTQYRRQLTEDPVSITTGPANTNLSVRPIIYSAGIRLCYRF
jgi:hypothetical protein